MNAYFIAFWNLENLFAPEGHPDREPWLAEKLANELRGWDQALFDRKVDQLVSIISQMNAGRGPDILGVCEVENGFALQAVANRANATLPGRSYDVVHFDAKRDHRGIDTAFIFDRLRLSVDRTKIFSHWVMRRTGTRDITQVTFATSTGSELVALANHWPSRSGSHHTMSQGFRMTAGETLGYWHERIREEKGDDIAVIAMGDFNDEPADPSVVIHANASREREDIQTATSARFYNLAWNYLRQKATSKSGRDRMLYGSLYFEGNGNIFDQILVARPLLNGHGWLRVREETARIEAFASMVSDKNSEGPIRFGLPKGNPAQNVNRDGFSDHFPVSVVIEEADGPV